MTTLAHANGPLGAMLVPYMPHANSYTQGRFGFSNLGTLMKGTEAVA